jgi:hypothetical protein
MIDSIIFFSLRDDNRRTKSLFQTIIEVIWAYLMMPVPSQSHYGFHSFPVVDRFCLFLYLWVLTFPL